ncbi:uncharacterized protein K02A2.6-like [Anthonomus grandis grandis]|uniref:uncharacterized protein K02A2.6-like n=1 Tax=Anthonomus grandis grandis TaxID=2921223 RepID=UPI0021655743|nr:uncharacterized protein K02A2.6-like [Anthonomus grandis grandis]
MYAIKDHTKPASIAWNETIQIGNQIFAFKIDTGSDVNIISQDAFKKLRAKSKLTPTKTKLSSFSGHEINIIGSSNIKCSKNGKSLILKFFITNVNTESVLGLQACIDLGIVAKIPPAPVEVIHQPTEKIIKIYSDVFDQPHVLRCNPFHINLQPCVKPIQAVCCKKTESRLKVKLEAELKRMTDEGFLEPTEEKTVWSHPMIASMKQNDDVSIFMDCRNLNKYLTADYYPLPFIEDDFSNIKGSQYFSLFTSPQAYMQIPLDEESSSICTIVTPCGRFKFKTIPYGFKRATDISHTVFSQIFHAIDGVFVYVDDILVYGKSKDEHNRRLIEVLDRARQYNLKFSKAKLQVDKSEIRFMGYVLSKDGAKFDKTNIEAIKATPPPINKQELQRFLKYNAGKDLAVACALSRSPLKKSSMCCVEETKVIPAHTLLCATEERINEFKKSLKEDDILQNVITYIKDGWPKYPSWIKSDARKYYNIREDLRFAGDLLFCDTKLVVPLKEKLEVLKQLHATHQGLKACQQKAKLLYFWPTMLKDIENYIAGCLVCQGSLKPDGVNKPVVSQNSPELPWIKIGIFFVHAERRDFAVITDYFSKFLIVKPINVKTVKAVTTIIEEVCATHGLPLEIVTINAPPFNTPEWKQFLKAYDINFSNPSDDLLEKHGDIAKALIENSISANSALFLAILEYNSTPKYGLQSPSELLMGRRLRTGLLVPKTMLMPNFDISKAIAAMKKGLGVLNKEKCGCLVNSNHL